MAKNEPDYLNPPVQWRECTISLPLKREQIQTRLGSGREFMRRAGYNSEKVEVNWGFTMKTDDPNAPPDAVLSRHPIFQRTEKASNSKFEFKLKAGEKSTTLRFQQSRLQPQITHFGDFWQEIKKIGEGWDFPYEKCKSFSLSYHNCFARGTQPMFWVSNQPKWEWVLPWFDGESLGFRTTYVPELTIPIEPPEDLGGTLSIRLTRAGREHVHPHLDISVSKQAESRSKLNLLESMPLAHSAIIETFENYFPEDAKKAFAVALKEKPKKKATNRKKRRKR